jgi:hypothetical protein
VAGAEPSRSVVALRTPSLSEEQLIGILTYRLAQYLLANQLDPQLIFERRLQHEPRANVSGADIHVMAGVSETGELLCYITLKAIPVEAGEVKFGSPDRPLFPVEEVFGWDVYSSRINQRHPVLRDTATPSLTRPSPGGRGPEGRDPGRHDASSVRSSSSLSR